MAFIAFFIFLLALFGYLWKVSGFFLKDSCKVTFCACTLDYLKNKQTNGGSSLRNGIQ